MIEFDDNVIQIIRKQDRTVSAANQTFFDSLPATEQRIFAAVSKHVQKFSSEGENFVFDDGNVLLTNQVERIILDALQSSKYPSDVNGFLRNFETLKQYNFDIHRDVNDLSPEQLGELINPIQRATVEQTLQGLTGSGVSTNFIEPIRTGIYQNIVAGSTKADLEAYLRRYILGNPDVDGLLSRYVKQVSRDALNQFDGQVNAKIASEFGLDAYRYVGSLIEDSRPQCRRWVAMGVIQSKDLPAEIAWMNANGTGAIPGTSPETFSIYRGGYNCRHSAIPFKLTKSQREKLNLEPAAVEPVKIDQQIKEVEKAVAKTEQQTVKATEKSKLNSNKFLTTQSQSIIEDFDVIMENTNDVIDKINNAKTVVTLRKPTECSSAGSKKLIGDNPNVTPFQIGTISSNAGGNCYVDNSAVNIKISKGEKIIFKKYTPPTKPQELEDFAKNNNLIIKKSNENTQFEKWELLEKVKDKNKYYVVGEYKDNEFKMWSISTLSRINDNNIAPTITHEMAHFLQNTLPTERFNDSQFSKLFKKNNLMFRNAPTMYGQTNKQEFWTESFTSYVYCNDWLKTEHPNVFQFVEDYLEALNVDRKTVKIAQ